MLSLEDMLNPLPRRSVEAPCTPALGSRLDPPTNRAVPPDFNSRSQNNILDELNTRNNTPIPIQQNTCTWPSPPSPHRDTQHCPHQIWPPRDPPILFPPCPHTPSPISNRLPTIEQDVRINKKTILH